MERRVFRGNLPGIFDIAGRKKDGSALDFQQSPATHSRPFLAQDGFHAVQDNGRPSSNPNQELIFEDLGTAAMVYEKDYTIIKVNGELQRLTGYDREEIEGVKTVFELIPDEDLSSFTKAHRVVQMSEHTFSMTFQARLLTKQGFIHDVYMVLAKMAGTTLTIATIIDITELRQAERALVYKSDFEKLIISISTEFINLPTNQLDSGMNRALKAVGEFVQASRCSIFRLSEDKQIITNTHEWCAPGVNPAIEYLQTIPADNYPWLMEQINRQDLIYIPNVMELPEEARAERELFRIGSIGSFVAVPMILDHELIGFISLSSEQESQVWEYEHISILRILGEVFVNALDRKRTEEALLRDESRLEVLLAMNQMTSASLQEIADFALEECVRLTKSKIGFLAFLSSDEGTMTVQSWSRSALLDCGMSIKPNNFNVADAGLWVESIRQRRPIITNDYAALNPLKKGLPENHLVLKRVLTVPIFDNNHIVALVGVGNKESVYDKTDIRELSLIISEMWRIVQRKQTEEQLRYMSLHDPLTKMFNRAYFEQEMLRLQSGRFDPIGLILCDVDGLKLINDTMGHNAGDAMLIKAAQLIRSCFRESDVVARVGGDEFAVLLPHTSRYALNQAYQRLRRAFDQYNAGDPGIPISISIGCACREDPNMPVEDLYREADANMYREKLNRRITNRNTLVTTLLKAMETRDFISQGHTERLEQLVIALARIIGLPESRIPDLRLLAQFHDIGKVAIPDHILFKPGPLTQEEFEEVKRHSEIGHRIALSSPELVHLADWILMHHEWCNGEGYPLGLTREQIPLECRILAIADAYDALTSNRPYRPAFPEEVALNEIIKGAGSQFDPDLTHRFVELIQNKERYLS